MLNHNIKELSLSVSMEPTWGSAMSYEWNEEYFKKLSSFVEEEYQFGDVFPPKEDIFNAFWLCPIDEVKVVILGQDPYHGFGQAHGLSFSVKSDVPFPPSLVAIFKEIKSDLGIEIPVDGDLSRWARQGVFLLNSTLTVRANQPGSHQKKGWERFSDRVIQLINESGKAVVFVLWGAFAQKKASLIDHSRHLVLQAPHPSPLSSYRGFFGCKHFSQANEFLKNNGQFPINW
jgi:uracil-DNA glycosylase